jgi:alpha-L-fucosidase
MKREMAMMGFQMSIVSALAVAIFWAFTTAEAEDAAPREFKPTHESLVRYGVPDWYKDAKFGIYLHWGLNCVPAYHGQYGGAMYKKNDKAQKGKLSVQEYHIKTYGPLNKFGFKDFIPMFKMEKFDPEYYGDLAKKVGAGYWLQLGVHHGGFAMYDSKNFTFNSFRMGPKRDVVAEIFAAMRKRGIHVGISTHIGRHWRYREFSPEYDDWDPKYEALYGHRRGPNDPPRTEDAEKWEDEHRYIIDKYKPDYIFIDGGIVDANRYSDMFIKALYRVTAYYYTRSRAWGKGVVLTWKRKAMKPDEAVRDMENLRDINKDFPGIAPYKWQIHTSLVGWFYTKGCEDRRIDAERYIRLLMEVVSRNGNLLLGITAKSDGTLTKNQIDTLDGIGKWLKVNGEGVYGTVPWKTHGSGVFSQAAGSADRGQRVEKDAVRFTAKGNAVYAFVGAWPANGKVEVKGLTKELFGGNAASVTMLGSPEPLKWKFNGDGLEVTLPSKKPCEAVWTLKVERE